MKLVLWSMVLIGDAVGLFLFFTGLSVLRRLDRQRKEEAQPHVVLSQSHKSARFKAFVLVFTGVVIAALTSAIYLVAVYL